MKSINNSTYKILIPIWKTTGTEYDIACPIYDYLKSIGCDVEICSIFDTPAIFNPSNKIILFLSSNGARYNVQLIKALSTLSVSIYRYTTEGFYTSDNALEYILGHSSNQPNFSAAFLRLEAKT